MTPSSAITTNTSPPSPSTPTPSSPPRDTPSFPARPINGGRLELRANPPRGTWIAQPKYNGWRALVHTPSGMMFNRHGEPLTIAAEFSEALEQLRQVNIEWLDCEALERRHNIGRGSLIILDYIPTGPTNESAIRGSRGDENTTAGRSVFAMNFRYTWLLKFRCAAWPLETWC